MHVIGRIGYHAGVSGTVTLDASERLIYVWCIATAGGATLTIAGGDSIALPSGIPFMMGLESRTEEWVGAALVFTGTASFFVKTKSKIPLT